MHIYTTAELEAIESIEQGWTANLIIEGEGWTANLIIEGEDATSRYKVWLERGDTTDGHPYDNTVTIERYLGYPGKWVTVAEYDGDNPPDSLEV